MMDSKCNRLNARALWLCTVAWLPLLTLTAAAANIEGKWAGYLESPGSIAAIRLNIASERDASTLTMNVYGEETVHPVNELMKVGTDMSFSTEMYKNKVVFRGRVGADRLAGTFELGSGGQTLSGEWSVRRFDDSKMVKNQVIPPRGENRLPAPTGNFAIGRRTYIWTDEARPEPITDDPSDKRALLLHLWYPAKRKSATRPAPYFEDLDSNATGLAVLRSIKTHANVDAAPADSKTQFPVIIFTPGLGSHISKYTGMIENLVSHGYVVAAINSGYDAGDFKLPDGKVISYRTALWDRTVSAGWTAENRKQFFDDRRRGWARDMSFVLDRLEQLDGDLRGRLDVSNAGAFGHSFGGQAVSIACADDTRFKACANLDGLAQGSAFLPGAKGGNLKQPFAFFTTAKVSPDFELKLMGLTRSQYNARERRRMLEQWKPSLKTRLAALEQGTFFIVVRGGTHASFSDSPLWETNPKEETLSDRLRRSEVINEYILAFFDRFLCHRNTRLLEPLDHSRPTVVVEQLKMR